AGDAKAIHGDEHGPAPLAARGRGAGAPPHRITAPLARSTPLAGRLGSARLRLAARALLALAARRPTLESGLLAEVGHHLGSEAADADAGGVGRGAAAEAHVEDHLVAAALALVAAQLRHQLGRRADEEAVRRDALVGPAGLALDPG